MTDVFQIVDFQPEHALAFRQLNQEWIEQFFKMEESDFKSLDNPIEYIIKPGGHILMVMKGDTAVGACALIKMDHPEYDYELAKMAVSPSVQGNGLGYRLGKAVLDRAKEVGASKVYLESNTSLSPAINLYRKLGFKEIDGGFSPYDRCDIQMVVVV